jgi:LysR family nitrogen assimilation transcriptional regulator
VEIRQLRYFVKIVDAGSLSKAAQTLHVAQPALSHQMTQLEAELGEQLLVRRYDGVKVSEPGEVFYRHACRVLRDIEDLAAAVKRPRHELAGTVCVGLPQCTSSLLALPLNEAVLRSHPGIRLEFFDEDAGNVVSGVRSGKLDVAVLASDDDAMLVDAMPLMDEELFFVCRRAEDVRPQPKPVSELAGVRLALPGASHPLRVRIEASVRACSAVTLAAPVLEAHSVNLLMLAAQTGLGPTILPWGAVSRLVAQGVLSAAPLMPAMHRRLYLCASAHGAPTLAALAVKDLLVQTVCKHVSAGAWAAVAVAGASAASRAEGHRDNS